MSVNENFLRKRLTNEIFTLKRESESKHFSVDEDVKIYYGNNNIYVIDVIASFESLEFFFEVKQNIETSILDSFYSLSENLFQHNRYFIIYSEKGSYLKLPDRNFEQFERFSDLYYFILNRNERNAEENYKRLNKVEILKTLFFTYVNVFSEENKSNKFNAIIDLIGSDDFSRDINIDPKNNVFYFTEDINDSNNFENKLFDCLLGNLQTGESFHRYGDINIPFYAVNNQSIRFNGIPGMNDISEVGYVDKYINRSYIALKSKKELSKINNKFILCSSKLEDNLNQWRLYGDDCKGASIEFEIIKESDNFFIRNISYGRETPKGNFHIELEFIKFLKDEFRNMTDLELEFRTMDIWKHFFKSFEYEQEQEVRVLYIYSPKDNTEIKWNLTNSHKILNPYCLFELKDLPLKINKINFGPKCSEIDLNIKQFQYLSDKKGNSFKFNKSKIENYR